MSELRLPALWQGLRMHERGLRDIGEQGQPHASQGHVAEGQLPPGVITRGAIRTRDGPHIALADQECGQALHLSLA